MAEWELEVVKDVVHQTLVTPGHHQAVVSSNTSETNSEVATDPSVHHQAAVDTTKVHTIVEDAVKDQRQVKTGLRHKAKARKVHSNCPECLLIMVFKKH